MNVPRRTADRIPRGSAMRYERKIEVKERGTVTCRRRQSSSRTAMFGRKNSLPKSSLTTELIQ
jgi:hypothetical protein